jgi:hypothetical protein
MPIQITVTGDLHIHIADPDQIVHPILAALAQTKGAIMAQLDDKLAELKAAVDTNSAKLAVLITDFENAGSLTPEQQTALDALKAEVVGNSDAIDAADPNAAV